MRPLNRDRSNSRLVMIEAIRIVELILHVLHNPPMRAIPTAQAVKPFTFLLRLSHTLRCSPATVQP